MTLNIVDGSPLNSATIKIVNGGSSSSGAISFGSRLNDINPADIASLQVLVPAAALCVRAANGVIVITTKEGQSGKAKITFSSSYSLTKYQNESQGNQFGDKEEMDLILPQEQNAGGTIYLIVQEERIHLIPLEGILQLRVVMYIIQ